jgi:DNA-directed RNA polymerase specialized sigma24 family protein
LLAAVDVCAMAKQLPGTRMQQFVLAKRLDGMRPAQIAELLGVSIDAVYARDQRARKRLSAHQLAGTSRR